MPRQITAADLITLAAESNSNEDLRYGAVCREFVVRLCGQMEGIGQEEEARQLAAALGMPHLYAVDEPEDTAESKTDWSAS